MTQRHTHSHACDLQARLDTRGQVPAGARLEAGHCCWAVVGPWHPWAVLNTERILQPPRGRPALSLLFWGGHGSTERVGRVCSSSPGGRRRRGTAGTPHLQEHAGQVVLGAEHPHLSHGPDPALARRRLRAAFGLRRLGTVCRKRAASAESPTTLNGTTRTGPASPGPPPRPPARRADVWACRAWAGATISPGRGVGWAGTSPRGQGGREQRVERLASGRSSLVLHLHQVSHVVCEAAAAVNREQGPRWAPLPSQGRADARLASPDSPSLYSCSELQPPPRGPSDPKPRAD